MATAQVPRPCICLVCVTSRRRGWWGVAFVVTLFVEGAMVSLPTAAKSGREISAFYAAHAAVILVQQVLGVAALGFLIAFALALGARQRRALLIGTALLAITELATNIRPPAWPWPNWGRKAANRLRWSKAAPTMPL